MRIQVNSDDSILGMREFSIQRPELRGWAAEHVFLAHMRAYDILVPRFSFVNVSVNGEILGVMALEEHMTKEMIENQGRRDSVIFHFDDQPRMLLSASNTPENLKTGIFSQHFNLEFVPFSWKRIRKQPEAFRKYARGLELLEGWRDGRFATSEVFDIEKWANYFAISEIWGDIHHFKINNVRLFFNPLTDRVEPIAYDRERIYYNFKTEERIDNALVSRHVAFASRLLDDPVLKAAYQNAITQISLDLLNSSSVRSKLQNSAQVSQDALIFDRSYMAPFPIHSLLIRAKKLSELKSWEQPVRFDNSIPLNELRFPIAYPRTILGWYSATADLISVQLKNQLHVPLKLCGFELINPKTKFKSKLIIQDVVGKEQSMPASTPWQFQLATKQLKLQPVKSITGVLAENTYLRVCSKPKGSTVLHYQDLKLGPNVFPEKGQKPIIPKPIDVLLAEHPFLKKENTTIFFKKGLWTVNKPIIFAKDINVNFEPGTTIRFGKNGGIIVYGDLQIIGTKNQPLILTRK